MTVESALLPSPATAPRWWRVALTGVVGAVALGSGSVAIAEGWVLHPSGEGVVAGALTLAALAALLVRRRFPCPVLGFAVAVQATTILVGARTVPAVTTIVALYSYGVLRSTRVGIVAAGSTAVIIAAAAWIATGEPSAVVPDVVLCTAVTAVSFSVRSQRQLFASYRERAELAEREQRAGPARAVAAERGRIARELHDVVAHHVSLLVVQAGAVRETLPPDHVTRPVLESMMSGGRQAMAELRDMLDALRIDDPVETDDSPALSLAPQPSLGRVDALVAGAVAAGQPVTLQVAGEPRVVPPGTSLAAYRIVQEALTNAVRHAPGAFTVVAVTYGSEMVDLTVTNGRPPLLDASGRTPTAPPGHGRSGHGIVGMTERAGLAHGTVAAHPAGEGWEVVARLPLAAAPVEAAPPTPAASATVADSAAR